MAKSAKTKPGELTDEGKKLRAEGAKWLSRVEAAGKKEETWLKDAEKATKAFTGETKGDDGSTLTGNTYDFNILFSNVETIVPAIINSPPAPDIRRRFGDDDPAAKDVAEILERAMRVQVDDRRLQVELEAEAQDIFLAGRGVVRLRFKSDFIKDTPDDDELKASADEEGDAVAVGEDGDEDSADAGGADVAVVPGDMPAERLANERIEFEVVSWRDYRHGPAKRWQDRPWDAFRFVVSREDEADAFDANLINSQTTGDDRKVRGETESDLCGWEVWDRKSRRVLFIDDDGVILKQIADPLGLKQFFCIATPAQAIEVTGRLMPVNPFSIYCKLADELDLATKRIAIITDEMKVRGWYPGDASDLKTMLDAADGEFVPISNADIWAANGGLQNAVAFWPIEKFITVLRELYSGRDQTKQAIYEITGISDIVRGATRANETLGAQQIKTQWGSLRIQKMQRMIERTARDLFVMMAEIIPSKFSVETLEAMTAVQIRPTQQDMIPVQPQVPPGAPPEAEQAAMQQAQQAEQERQAKIAKLQAIEKLLQQPLSTMYRVDVESDSTVKADLTRQRGEMAEFMNGSAQYFAAVGPLVQAGTLPKEAATEIYAATARMFNLGKAVEDTLERLNADAKASADQPPPPSPEEVKAKADAEARAQDQAAKQADREQEHKFKAEEHGFRMAEMKQESALKRQDARASENQALIAAGLPPMPDSEPVPTEAILAAIQAQNQQMQQILMILAKALTAPKTVQMPDGRTITAQTVMQ